MKPTVASRFSAAGPARQQGVVLMISLIVLVAMTLAGIALVRSVDTSNVIAGNLAFKQSTTQASGRGVEAATTWLMNNSGTAVLNNTDSSAGYFSAAPAAEPDWSADASWANAKVAPDASGNSKDSAGNTVSYIIHRMCTQADTPYNGSNAGVMNQCATSLTSGTCDNCSMSRPINPTVPPKLYYRVTSRVAGPRNTYSVVQAMILVDI